MNGQGGNLTERRAMVSTRRPLPSEGYFRYIDRVTRLPSNAGSGSSWFWSALLLLPFAGLAGCHLWSRPSGSEGYWLPITAAIRFDPSVGAAAIDYTDACGQRQTVPVGERFQTAIHRDMALVFEKTISDTDGQTPIDGVLDLALGFQEATLFIPKKASKTYPMTISVGGTATYTDQTGRVLYKKNLRTEAKTSVQTDASSCEVQGVENAVSEAIAKLSQGFKEQLGTSTRLREAAEVGARSRSSRPGAVVNAAAVASDTGLGSTSLSFRVMFREGERPNGRLDSGEPVLIVADVTNTGDVVAKDVVLQASGTPDLIDHLPHRVVIGDVQPQETKHIELSGTVPTTTAMQQAEVVLSVVAMNASSVDQKRFVLEWDPLGSTGDDRADEGLPDRPVATDPHRVGVVVGISHYRDEAVPGLPSAQQDATRMAKYLISLAGIAPARVVVRTDDQALKDDLVEIFEDWLPSKVTGKTDLFVFMAARAIVQPSGAVALMPYEYNAGSSDRVLSLRRIYDALSRLPVSHVIMVLDLGILANSPLSKPNWQDIPASLASRLVRVVNLNMGASGQSQEPSVLSPSLLQALRGEADHNQDGAVSVSELCTYMQRLDASRAGHPSTLQCLLPSKPSPQLTKLPLSRFP